MSALTAARGFTTSDPLWPGQDHTEPYVAALGSDDPCPYAVPYAVDAGTDTSARKATSTAQTAA